MTGWVPQSPSGVGVIPAFVSVPSVITGSPLPLGTTGTLYQFQLTASGGTSPYTWTLVSASPNTASWLSLTSGGLLQGTPGTVETETIKVKATDSLGVSSAVATLSLQVIAPLAISTSSPLPAGTQGSAYSTTIAGTGGLQPYLWQILSAAPNTGSWMSINAATGVLSGTPGTAETESVTIELTDSTFNTVTNTFSLTVNAVSGQTISNNQPLTISGTGFGTKSGQVAPQLADSGIDAPVGSTSPQWTQSQNAPNGLSGIYNMQNQPVGFSPSGALIGAPHPFVTTLQAGCHQFLAGSQPSDPSGGETGNDVGTAKSMVCPTTTFCWRQAFWVKIDPNLFIDPQSDQNTKLANYNMGTVFYPGSGNFIYTNMQANASILVNALRQFNAGNPTVISVALPLAANPFAVGQRVCFTGMPSTHSALNNVTGNITAIGGVNNNWTATLALDTTGFATFATSARTVVSIDATNPAVVHFTDSGPTNPCAIGSMVNFFGVTGMTTINNQSANVQIFVTQVGGTSPNYTATVNFNGGATPGSGGLMYIGMAPTPRYPDINVNPLLVTDGNEQPSSAPMWDLPDNLGHGSSFMSRVFHPANLTVGWCRVVSEGCIDATVGGPGYYKETWYSQGLNQVKIGTYGSIYSGRTTNTAGMAAGHFTVQQGNYMRDRSNNNFRYYCDGFLDLTGPGVTGQCAVVYVTDNPVFASSLVKQEQIAATWTNTQISIPHFKQGALQSNTTGYIHVCRETDAVGTALASGSFTIGATSVPVIANASLPNAVVSSSYSTTITVSGGTPPYTFYLPTALPNTGNWLSINSITGVLSGTPSTAETENVFIGVKDANGYTGFANLSLTVATVAFDRFIGPSGSDANPGTQVSPWAITSLLPGSSNRSLMAGKRIGVLPGTYNIISAIGGSTANSFSSPVLDVPPGTSGAHTILQSTVPLGAILDGGLTDANAPNRPPLLGHVNPGDGFYTIDGFEVRNANDRLISVGGSTGAGSPANCSGVVVQNCLVHKVTSTSTGSNSTGITGYALNGGLIQNNFVTNIVNSTNRNSGIETWSCQNTSIIFNTVIMNNAGADAIYIKNAGQKDVTIAYNYVDLSAAPSLAGSGACAWDLQGGSSDTSTVHNNIILVGNSVSWCFATGIAGVPSGSAAEKQVFYNNTFVCTGGGMRGVQSLGSASITTQYNNIYKGVFNPYSIQTGTGTYLLSDYNLYQSVGVVQSATAAGGGGTTFTTLAGLHGAGLDNHSLNATATFVGGTPSLPSQAYQLASGSPGQGTGSTNGTTGGTATDMGAWGNGATQIGCNFVATPNV